MPPVDDLSDYERLRLENIKRNAEFLAGLGLSELKPKPNPVLEEKRLSIGKRKRDDFESRKVDVAPIRRSARVQLQQEGIKLEMLEHENAGSIRTDEPSAPSYEDMPLDSDELDDSEFQVFVALKAWRLRTCRELDIEPYKICQNRTLAELVRRRRNSPEWAAPSKSDDEREVELLECWGIGPSKAKAGGYGDSLIKEIDGNQKLLDLLDLSRQNGDSFPIKSE